jgi:hypothetical protein
MIVAPSLDQLRTVASASRYVKNSSYLSHSIRRPQFLALLEWQNFRCAYCTGLLDFEAEYDEAKGRYKNSRFVIDHDHACCDRPFGSDRQSCGHCIRGVLCLDCNIMLERLLAPPAFRHLLRLPASYRVLRKIEHGLFMSFESRSPMPWLMRKKLGEEIEKFTRRTYQRKCRIVMQPFFDAYTDQQRLGEIEALLWPTQ